MSPEQVQGKPVDHRSDIYSFGVTCYHLLAGEPPFRGATAFEVALKHVQERPRPLAELRPDLPRSCAGGRPDDGEGPGGPPPVGAGIPPRAGEGARRAVRHTAALALSQDGVRPVEPPPARGRWWLWVGLAGALATAAGALAAVVAPLLAEPPRPPRSRNRPRPRRACRIVRPAERLTTARERELLTLLHADRTELDDTIKASVELGSCTSTSGTSRRRTTGSSCSWRRATSGGSRRPARLASPAGSGWRWCSLTRTRPRRRTSCSWRWSGAAAEVRRPRLSKSDRTAMTVTWTLLRFPDLSHAVSDALNRNAAKPRQGEARAGGARAAPHPVPGREARVTHPGPSLQEGESRGFASLSRCVRCFSPSLQGGAGVGSSAAARPP
jgi:serine/threonine-protein kinase